MCSKLSRDQVDVLIQLTHLRKEKNPSMRHGQALMNELHAMRPDMYHHISRDVPHCDPFYSDTYIPAFFEYITDRSQ